MLKTFCMLMKCSIRMVFVTGRRASIGLLFLWAMLVSHPAHAQNLVVNPGFESGTTGWTGTVSIVASSPHSGDYCLEVEDLLDPIDERDNVAAMTTAIMPITQGGEYTLSVWVRGTVEGQTVLVSLLQYDSGNAWISGCNLDMPVTVGTDWYQFRQAVRSFDSRTAGVKLTLRPVLWTWGGELSGKAYFDDVVFEAVDLAEKVQGEWLINTGNLLAWQSPVEQKVRRDLPLSPTRPLSEAISLSAAGGELESAQIVLVPLVADELQAVTVTPLTGPGKTEIPASALVVREVAYVEVTEPTDFAGMRGWLPDPLPLWRGPQSLGAGIQAPLWLTVRVPDDTPAGDYEGELTLALSGAGLVSVPIRLHVWGFSVPRERHLRTGYGITLNSLDLYHNLNGDRDKRRQVLRLYLGALAENRLSAKDPFADDRFRADFPNWNWVGGTVLEDPEAPSGPRLIEVVDASDTANVYAWTSLLIPIQAGIDYSFSWKAKTDGVHDYSVTVSQYDAHHDWLSGKNLDFIRTGNGEWQSENVTISDSALDTKARAVRIYLWARPWTEGGVTKGRTFFDDIFFAASGVPTNAVANGDFDMAAEDIGIDIDFSAFDDAAAFALDLLGADSFDLPLPGFASGYQDAFTGGQLLSFAWGTPDYETLFGRLLRAVDDHLASRGWLDRAYVYWYDEPVETRYEDLIDGMRLLNEADPRLQRFLTEQAEAELLGSVDIWDSRLDFYSPGWAWPRQAVGEQVWWYVCTGPRSPYPTNFIDYPGPGPRILSWMAWLYGVQGSSYWDTVYWTNDEVQAFRAPENPLPQDPWTDPQSYTLLPGEVPVVHEYGNGDGRLLYPPRGWQDGVERIEGPTPSIRFELIREGIEDFEYFWLLKSLAAELDALGTAPDLVEEAQIRLQIPASIVGSTREFTDDPSVLADYRERVGELLEQIESALLAPDKGKSGSGSPGRN